MEELERRIQRLSNTLVNEDRSQKNLKSGCSALACVLRWCSPVNKSGRKHTGLSSDEEIILRVGDRGFKSRPEHHHLLSANYSNFSELILIRKSGRQRAEMVK